MIRPTKYRKKPVVIEAMQCTYENVPAILAWVGSSARLVSEGAVAIDTLEGEMWATEGDFVIKGIKGEFYPCKPDIFQATYEHAD